MPSVWSFGGGTQSAAIAALLCQGRLPKPDYAVMADTGREKAGTFAYAEAVVFPALAAVGITIEVVRTVDYATVDMWGGEDGKSLLLPVFTRQAGRLSKLPGYCSNEWKSRVIGRYLKRRCGLKSWVTWLGISTDEMQRVRVRGSDGPYHYPLIQDIPMRRSDCIQLVTEEMGWPAPPRSACYMCPNQGDAEWKRLRAEAPAEFAAAVAMDEEIRLTDPHAYLHKSGRPLGLVDFDAQTEMDFEDDGKGGCDSGFCFV